jgi:hypothetical protein
MLSDIAIHADICGKTLPCGKAADFSQATIQTAILW